MLKRMTSLNSNSNDHDEACCLSRRAGFFLRIMILCLSLGTCQDSFAQGRADCDSLEVAWSHYDRADFSKALTLVANCEETSALELRVFVALKRRERRLADTLLCKLLKRNPNYAPDPSALPVADFVARVEKLKTAKACEPLPPPPYIIKSELEILGSPELRWPYINWGGGTYMGLPNNYRNPVLTHLRIGVGFGEIEFRTIDIINTLPKGTAQLMTGAFKLGLPEGKPISGLPGITVTGRTWFGVLDSDTLPDGRKFRKEMEGLVGYASKTLGKVRLHAGLSYTFLKARALAVRDTHTKEDSSESKHSKIFAALQLQVNSSMMLMAGFEPVALYKVEGSQLQEVGTRNLVTIAVKIFPQRWLALDGGCGFWRKHPSKDRVQIKIGATMGVSISETFKKLNKTGN